MRKFNFETSILRRLDMLEPEIKASAEAGHRVDSEYFSRRLIAGVWEDKMRTTRSERSLSTKLGADQVRWHLIFMGYPAETISQPGDIIHLENASYHLRVDGSYVFSDVKDCWAWSFSSNSPIVKMDALDFAGFMMQFDKAIPDMRKAMEILITRVCKAYAITTAPGDEGSC